MSITLVMTLAVIAGANVALAWHVRGLAQANGSLVPRRHLVLGPLFALVLLALPVAAAILVGPPSAFAVAAAGAATLVFAARVLMPKIPPSFFFDYGHPAIAADRDISPLAPPSPPHQPPDLPDPPQPPPSSVRSLLVTPGNAQPTLTWRYEPSGARYLLCCRSCGSVLTRPLREIQAALPALFSGEALVGGEPFAEPKPGSFWRSFSRWPSNRLVPEHCTLGGIDFGSSGRVVLFSRADLAGGALPIDHAGSAGYCCGYSGDGGTNVVCHGCGEYRLFEVETCCDPVFFAARLAEVELCPA